MMLYGEEPLNPEGCGFSSGDKNFALKAGAKGVEILRVPAGMRQEAKAGRQGTRTLERLVKTTGKPGLFPFAGSLKCTFP